jgi:molecular chaperone GrpE
MVRVIDRSDEHSEMPDNIKPLVDVVATALPGSVEEELEGTRVKLQRLAADFANFRKRTRREKETLSTRPLKQFFSVLLPVLDNYERAVSHMQIVTDTDKGTTSASIAGLGMILTQLQQLLHENGLSRFASEGQRFTPHRHEAVDHTYSEEVDAGHIIRETVSGYAYHDEVLRPAKVVVSRGSEEGSILIEFDIEDESTEPDHAIAPLPEGIDDPDEATNEGGAGIAADPIDEGPELQFEIADSITPPGNTAPPLLDAPEGVEDTLADEDATDEPGEDEPAEAPEEDR